MITNELFPFSFISFISPVQIENLALFVVCDGGTSTCVLDSWGLFLFVSFFLLYRFRRTGRYLVQERLSLYSTFSLSSIRFFRLLCSDSSPPPPHSLYLFPGACCFLLLFISRRKRLEVTFCGLSEMSELLSIAIPNRQTKRMYARLAHVLISMLWLIISVFFLLLQCTVCQITTTQI